MWFMIKAKPSCKDGARHLWMSIHKARYLPDNLKAIVDPVLQRNGFFGHPENMLLSMITDDRRHVRELGLRRIMRARANKQPKRPKNGIRVFQVPTFNMDAEDYIELIDWQSGTVTEPPVTKLLSDNELESFVSSGETPIIEFPRFPCHTQAVERCAKNVTEASKAVMGQEARDGFIRARNAARMVMPVFNTKQEYCTG